MGGMTIFGVVQKAIGGRGSLSPVDDSRGWHVIQEFFPGAFQADEKVSVESQLSFFAVYACVTLISSDMGKLRQMLVEKTTDGIWQEVSSPAFSPVLRNPNRYQNHIQFKQTWAISKLTRGNTYGLKVRDARGVVTSIYILDPDRVTPMVAVDGSIFYALSQDNLSGIEQAQVVVPASEIIHDRMNCLYHPLVGISPLYACALASQQGLAIQRQTRNMFKNGGRPAGILTAPAQIGNEKAAELKARWDETYGPNGTGGTAVLGNDLKYEALVMKSVDAQLVEQLKLTAEQVCTAFRVPPFKIAVGQMPTFQNGEVLNQIYYDNCLQSMIEEYEVCMDEGLGIGEGLKVQGRELGIELDLDGLMRMDSERKIKALSEGVKGSLIKINEGRKKLDLPKVEGGDDIYMQVQYVPLGTPPAPAAEPPALPDPPIDDPDETDKALALLWKRSPETLTHA
jgi:HK97 family phage portal protein